MAKDPPGNSPTSASDEPASDSDQNRGQRSRAEWVTLVVSCLVLAGVVTLILTQVGADDAPAQPVATVGSVSAVDEQWFVDVTVENRGGATAADVQVIAELTGEGLPKTSRTCTVATPEQLPASTVWAAVVNTSRLGAAGLMVWVWVPLARPGLAPVRVGVPTKVSRK